MPVESVKELTHEEFLGWLEFFDRRPIGWKEDLRTAYLMQAAGVDKKPEDMFPSLRSIFKPIKDNPAVASLRSSYMFKKMMSAKGGASLGDLKLS